MQVSHWPEAVDGIHFPSLPVLEVTERVQPLFSVLRQIQNIIRSIDPNVKPTRLLVSFSLCKACAVYMMIFIRW